MTVDRIDRALRHEGLTCAALIEQTFERIEAAKELNAFITVMHDAARQRARELDCERQMGKDRGPLHGVPVAVKDTFFTRGVRTTNGSKIFADQVPEYNAAVVDRLEAAGAVIVGKTNMHELAYGITSGNPHFGPVRNPRDLDCIPGGSSGGSGAAVGAGIVPIAMGTDTGGSIRNPAAYCGCIGLKPTYGRVSRYGCHALGLTLDHMGPLAASVRDAAFAFNAIADGGAADCAPEHNFPLTSVRIGWPENFFFDDVDAEVRRAIDDARDRAKHLGAAIVPVRMPNIAELNTIARVILLAEASALMERHFAHRDAIGADVLALLDQGRLLAATDYVNAQRARTQFHREFEELFREIDLVFTPCAPITAPRIGQMTVAIDGIEEDVRLASTRFVRGINVVGLPAMSIPCGKSKAGLPIGLQIIARPLEERLLLQTAAALEDSGITRN